MDIDPDDFHRRAMARMSALAASERAYLKSERDFVGITVPVGRRIVRDLALAVPSVLPAA